MRFVPFDEFGKNIASALHYFFMLFGCDFFGKELLAFSVNAPILSLIRLPFLPLLIGALVLTGKKFIGRVSWTDRQVERWPVAESDYLAALLALAVVIDVLAAVFSTQIVDATSLRFFFPALVFGAILIARLHSGTRWLGAYFYLALSVSLGFSLAAYAQNSRRTVLMPKEIETMSSWLAMNGLNKGYGPYWASSIVTGATQGRVTIRALVADGEGNVKAWEWAANRKWYRPGATSGARAVFILADKNGPYFYREADVERSLGEPLEKHEVGSYIINIYDPGNERLQSLCLPSRPGR